MSVIDQPALDLPGLAAPPPDVLAGLTRAGSSRRARRVDPVDRQDDRTGTERLRRGGRR